MAHTGKYQTHAVLCIENNPKGRRAFRRMCVFVGVCACACCVCMYVCIKVGR
jgi:hypothetical protein